MGRLLFFREREYYVPVKKVDHISTLVAYIYIATLLKRDIMNLIQLLLNMFSTGRSYLTDVFWWTGTLSSEYSAI